MWGTHWGGWFSSDGHILSPNSVDIATAAQGVGGWLIKGNGGGEATWETEKRRNKLLCPWAALLVFFFPGRMCEFVTEVSELPSLPPWKACAQELSIWTSMRGSLLVRTWNRDLWETVRSARACLLYLMWCEAHFCLMIPYIDTSWYPR